MRETVAGVASAQNFQGVATRFDEIDFAFFVDYESDAVRNSVVGKIHAIFLRDLAIQEIAEQRKRQAKALRKGFQRRRVVGTEGKDFRARFLEFLHSSLEFFHFSGSTL